MPRVDVERRLPTPAATPSASSMPLNSPAQGGTAAEGKSTNSEARALQRKKEGSAHREAEERCHDALWYHRATCWRKRWRRKPWHHPQAASALPSQTATPCTLRKSSEDLARVGGSRGLQIGCAAGSWAVGDASGTVGLQPDLLTGSRCAVSGWAQHPARGRCARSRSAQAQVRWCAQLSGVGPAGK